MITLNYAHLFDVQKPKSCTYLRSFDKVLNTFYISCPHLHQLSIFCRSVRQGTYFSKFCVKMPQPKDPSRRTLVERASGGCLSRPFASPGHLPLQANCPSRLMPDATSGGQILRVIARKRKRFARTCRFARMEASRGCVASRGLVASRG